ncbi:unnamed protein product, partial [Polarella glacialis]
MHSKEVGAIAAQVVFTIRYLMTRKYDVGGLCNGILVGLVSVTAGCATMESGSAVAVGFIGSFVYQGASMLLVRLKIDDPVDASPVHGACGLWGVLAAALFDWGKGFDEFHGPGGMDCARDVSDPSGCASGSGALLAQIIMILAIIVWSGTWSTLTFALMRFTNMLRIDDDTEEMGMDAKMHSPTKAYIMVPEQIPDPPIVPQMAQNSLFVFVLDTVDFRGQDLGVRHAVAARLWLLDGAPALQGFLLLMLHGQPVVHAQRVLETSVPRLELWHAGEDKYQPLVGIVAHPGSCQPACTEQRSVILPPDIPYEVLVEVAQIDMHSPAEHVGIAIGDSNIKCELTVASDYNCSLAQCARFSLGAVQSNSELLLTAVATRTRNTCKCALGAFAGNTTRPRVGDVDCYSELLSGLDETFGMLVRLTFIPQVQASWVKSAWGTCDQRACVVPGAVSLRTVQCRIFAPLDVAPGGDRCLEQSPATTRSCAGSPECAPPAACDGCFSVVHLNTGSNSVGLNWSSVLTVAHGSGGLAFAGQGTPLQFRLLTGLAKASCSATLRVLPKDVARLTSCVSLTDCTGKKYLVRKPLDATPRTSASVGDASFKFALQQDIATPQLRMQGTFHLRRVANAGYVLEDPYGSSSGDPADQVRELWAMAFSAVVGVPATWVASPAATAPASSSLCALHGILSEPPWAACPLPALSPVRGWCCPDGPVTPGRCCPPGGCSADADSEAACREGGCDSPGYALISTGRCEDIRCSMIEDSAECEVAAAAHGLQASGGNPATAKVRLSP